MTYKCDNCYYRVEEDSEGKLPAICDGCKQVNPNWIEDEGTGLDDLIKDLN